MTNRYAPALFLALVLAPASAGAQSAGSEPAPRSVVVRQAVPAPVTTPPAQSMTFDAAIERALANNPNVAIAENAIRRAEALLQQARTVTRPTVTGGLTTTILDSERAFGGQVSQPQTQTVFAGNVSYPILAPSRWALRDQAADQVEVATLGAVDRRRGVAVATAQAYLAVIAQKRLVEANARALETARYHLEYANNRLQAGAGSRLNALRAEQEVATSDVLLEAARLGVRRAQEALGVLVATDAPVDAAAEPALEVPAAPAGDEWVAGRTDVQVSLALQRAAQRIVDDSWKDWVPTATVGVEPSYTTPSGLFQPSRGVRGLFQVSVPIYDGGVRRATRLQRETALDLAGIQLTDVQLRARAELRTAQAAVESTMRALDSARAAAATATEVLRITDVAFRAGATTNLEVIDAQRRSRDADTAAAQAEDRARQARLDLLVALGRFPG
jgi:outer membrane protein TolC